MKEKLGLKFIMAEGTGSSRFYDSTDRNTCIDWCLTNNSNENEHNVTVYESWFSDHKPLWLEIGAEINFI